MIIIALHCIDGEFVPLSHVESINSGTKFLEEQDIVANVLKADKHIRITTFSGNRYICSMRQTMELIGQEYPESHEKPKSADECYENLVYPSWEKLWRTKKTTS